MILQTLNKLKIKQIVLSFIIISILMLGGSLALIKVNFTKTEKNWNTYKEVISTKAQIISNIKIELGFDGAIHNFKNYILRGNEKFATAYQKNSDRVEGYIKQLDVFELNELELQTINQTVSLLNRFNTEIEFARKMRLEGKGLPEVDRAFNSNDAEIKADFVKLANYYQDRSMKLFEEHNELSKSSELAMFSSGGVILVLMFLLKMITDFKIIKPLQRGNAAVIEIADGNYDSKIEVTSHDEIGETLTQIEKMRLSLKKSVGEIEEALREASVLNCTIEGLGTNVIIINEKDEISYLNKQTSKNLENLEPAIREAFPNFDKSTLIGSSIYPFFKDSGHVKSIIDNLKIDQQHKEIVSVGPLKVSFSVGGVFKNDGNKIGHYIEWQDITKEYTIETQIKTIASSINTATSDISQGNQNLSERTESQAASIEQTTASMQQITERVNETAQSAREAAEISNATKNSADRGGDVVKTAIHAMSEISESSKKINEIIGVIDEIAFQTNLLALNAAVEAARAGEQGRGFAVVASEVRSLAGRSATAAKEIKDLITDSVKKVESGSMQVNETGQCLDEIINSVQDVTRMVNSITQATQDQASGIDEINRAITQMDSFTQQNASLVEEAASASESLKEQSGMLVEIIKQEDV